jgi:hypothetical protein
MLKHRKINKPNTIEQQEYDDDRSSFTNLQSNKDQSSHRKPVTLPKLKFMEFSGEWDETV